MKLPIFPIDENVTEPRRIKPNEPDSRYWQKYDHWRMLPDGTDGIRRYWNSRYSLAIKPELKQSLVSCLCYTVLVIRADQSAHRDYRDYMRIKDDIFGPEYEAIELLPARSRENDPSNAFVLYVFSKALPIGERHGEVLRPEESKASQREFSSLPRTVINSIFEKRENMQKDMEK